MKQINKPNINMTLNINNYLGSYTNHLDSLLIWVLIAGLSFCIYPLFLLPRRFPLLLFLAVHIPINAVLYLIIVKHWLENKRIRDRLKRGEFDSISDIMADLNVHDNGILEYGNGEIAVLIEYYTKPYYSNEFFAYELQKLLDNLMSKYSVTMFGYVVVNEEGMYDKVGDKMQVFENSVHIKDRLEFYKTQTDYVDNNSTLYRNVIKIATSKVRYNQLLEDIDDLTKGRLLDCVNYNIIKDKAEAFRILSRDALIYLSDDVLTSIRFDTIKDEYDNKILSIKYEE